MLRSFRLYHKTFGRVPPFLANVKVTKCLVPKTNLKDPPEVVLTAEFSVLSCTTNSKLELLLMFFYTLTTCAVLLKLCLYPSHSALSTMQLAFAMFNLISIMLATTTAYGLTCQTKMFQLGANALLSNLPNFPTDSTKSNQIDTKGLVMFYYLLGMLVFYYPVTIIVWYLHFDPLSVVLSYMFDAGNSTGYIYAFLRLSALIVNVLVLWAVPRGFGVCLFVIIMFLSSTDNYLEAIGRSKNCDKLHILQHYQNLTIIYNAIRLVFGCVALGLVVTSQLLLVQLAWFCINCFAVIPFFIVISFGAAFVGGLGIAILLFQEAAEIKTESTKLLEMMVMRFVGCNNKEERYWYRKWKAQLPLVVHCGEQFVFMRDSITIYLDLLTNNITNAVLLFRF